MFKDLVVRLRTGHDNRVDERKSGNYVMFSKTNVMEQHSNSNSNQTKHAFENFGSMGSVPNCFNGKCYICEKVEGTMSIIVATVHMGDNPRLTRQRNMPK